jgi:hypothetical protein
MKCEQFTNYLEEDLAWRKKELSSLILVAEGHEDNKAILKSIILLLYAHWEGYIKKSSKIYLKYIAESKKGITELTQNFKAVALKDMIAQCIEHVDHLTLQNEMTVINRLAKLEHIKFKVNINVDNDQENSIIDTAGNLTPKILRNIHSIIGLNYKTTLELKESHINSHLLRNRNLIAHGGKYIEKEDEDFSLELDEIKKLKDIVLSIIDNFKDELIEYAEKEYFLHIKSAQVEEYQREREAALESTFQNIEIRYKK